MRRTGGKKKDGTMNKFLTFERMDPILIYVRKKTNRLQYTFRVVFRAILKAEYRITTDLDEFQSSDLPKFTYGDQAFSDDIFFKSSGLLSKRHVESVETETLTYKGLTAVFPVYDDNSAMPFDVFSAIFYFVSRYEEYLPFVRDIHGRFTARLSQSSQWGLLEKPVVNIWALEIKKILQDKYPSLKFPEVKYKFVPTYDIDSAYAYRQKGLVRNIGGYLIDMKEMRWSDVAQRTRVLLGMEKDPFDTYDLQIGYQKKYNLHPVYFILFGMYGRYNKNLNIRNKYFRQLIKTLGDYAAIGIHPSYHTVNDVKLMRKEIEDLSKVINKEITASRQHFLRLMLPGTYRNLIENDIRDDYTMGYASLPGFRAGICTTYPFYDLDMEEETKLQIHPFTVMDGTLRDYMNYGPLEAIAKIKQLIGEVRAVNGTFISLWHNEPLSDQKRWTGWRKVYEELLKEAVE